MLCCLPCSDPHGEFQGLNCFIERESVEGTATTLGLSLEEAEQTLAKARELLHARRLERPGPHVDDKVSLGQAADLAVACKVLLAGTVNWQP